MSETRGATLVHEIAPAAMAGPYTQATDATGHTEQACTLAQWREEQKAERKR
jgi:hypothetical protein